MSTATHSWKATSLVFALAVLGISLSGVSAPTHAITAAAYDHYKVYWVDPANFIDGEGVALNDQFLLTWHTFVVRGAIKLAPPASKNGSIIYDDILHYTWYEIVDPPRMQRKDVAYENQFGPAWLSAGDPRWLLTPAVKNPLPDDPGKAGFPISNGGVPANHYLCWDALGAPVSKIVTLETQFGFEDDVKVLDPKYFCNPVMKQHAGVVYDIIDDQNHLVCYQLDPIHSPLVASVFVDDQFLQNNVMGPVESELICVPTFKEGYVQTEKSTWGKLKSIYR
jgi:hypothetical protein